MQVGKQIQHYRKEKIYLKMIWLKSSLSAVNPFPTGNAEQPTWYSKPAFTEQGLWVSLDQLIKGDVETMKQIIHDQEFMRYQKMEWFYHFTNWKSYNNDSSNSLSGMVRYRY